MDLLPAPATFIAFTAASLLLAATPGPDMTLSISRALSQGRGPALFVVLGTSLGIVVHTLLVAFGISALITASPTAFTILKTGGAGYLLWLAIRAVRVGSSFSDMPNTSAPKGACAWGNISTGFWVNLLNPKVIIFFMTFLPQFVSAGDPDVTGKLVVLGLLFIVLGMPVNTIIVLAADKLSIWLRNNKRVLRGLDYTFAGVFSIFAAKIFMTQGR
ncbi:LysE family translocator [Mycoplana ramosa]|uniref:LysE family translocator n=1 Tax=Mycoplana ramosa TaxID=40837 RepID=A0ABW3YV77_MYCRA